MDNPRSPLQDEEVHRQIGRAICQFVSDLQAPLLGLVFPTFPAIVVPTTAPTAPSPEEPPAPEWLSTREAAQLLGISERTLRRRYDEAPTDLRSAAIGIGRAGARQKLRWRRDDLEVWFRGLNQTATESQTAPSPQRNTRTPKAERAPTPSSRPSQKAQRRGSSLLSQARGRKDG